MLWNWTDANDEEWMRRPVGLEALYRAWVEMAVPAAIENPAVRAVLPSGDPAAWFRAHLLKHLPAFQSSPLDPETRSAARQIGFAHIQAEVLPSWFVGLYNLMFAAYHERATDPLAPCPPLSLIRQRWLADVETTLDTYTVAMHTQFLRLSDLAFTDPLTGLLNRRGFWQRVTRDTGPGAAGGLFVLMDLDRFKSLNDEHGHPAGDVALQQFASVMQSLARADDAVARLGGDEFCWWVTGVTHSGAFEARLRQLSERVTRHHLRFSAGLALCPRHGHTVEALYHAADVALYRAKAGGGRAWAVSEGGLVHLL